MKEKDAINPEHYQNSSSAKECIVLMFNAFGRESVISFCQLNAFKYLYRQDKKGVAEQDLNKARWYAVVAELLRQGRHINTALAYVRSEAYKKLTFPDYQLPPIEMVIMYGEEVVSPQFMANMMGFLSKLLPNNGQLLKEIILPFSSRDLSPQLEGLQLIGVESALMSKSYFYA